VYPLPYLLKAIAFFFHKPESLVLAIFGGQRQKSFGAG
jgi:hypothetical protein